jgi:hypothetical protein
MPHAQTAPRHQVAHIKPIASARSFAMARRADSSDRAADRARPFAEVRTFLAAIINRSPMEAARADRSRSASLMVAVSDL